MSALFVFLIQLLQAAGFPIDAHTGAVMGTTSAALRSPHHGATYRSGDSDDLGDVTFEEAPPCDISNGF